MSWQNTCRGKRKKALPNRFKSRPTISFRSNLSPEELGYIKKLSERKEKSEFINSAIKMRFYLSTSKERFISEVIRENFELAKDILRNEGTKRTDVTGK